MPFQPVLHGGEIGALELPFDLAVAVAGGLVG